MVKDGASSENETPDVHEVSAIIMPDRTLMIVRMLEHVEADYERLYPARERLLNYGRLMESGASDAAEPDFMEEYAELLAFVNEVFPSQLVDPSKVERTMESLAKDRRRDFLVRLVHGVLRQIDESLKSAYIELLGVVDEDMVEMNLSHWEEMELRFLREKAFLILKERHIPVVLPL